MKKRDEKAEDDRNGKKGPIRKRVSANAPPVRSSVLALFIVRSNLVPVSHWFCFELIFSPINVRLD